MPLTARQREYREYLQSGHWHKLRRAKLKEAAHACQRCSARNVTLDVHHLRYRQLLDVTTDDLEVLCRTCHKLEHGIKPDAQPKKRKRRRKRKQLKGNAKKNAEARALKRAIKKYQDRSPLQRRSRAQRRKESYFPGMSIPTSEV